MKKIGLGISVTMVFTVIMFIAAIDALRMPFLAGIYPGVIATLAFVVGAVQVIQELRKGATSEGALDTERSSGFAPRERYFKALRVFIWMMSYYLTMSIIGFKLATVAYLVGYLKFEDKSRWPKIVIICVGMFLFLEIFRSQLGVWWPQGLVGGALEEVTPRWIF